MPRYLYLGQTTNLGRFGTVRRGDVVNLSDKEEESIRTDKDVRFRPYKEGDEKKLSGSGLDLPPNFDAMPEKEQEKVLRLIRDEERLRLEKLGQSVNPASGISGAGAAGQPNKASQDERARREALDKANRLTESENLAQMSKPELEEELARIKRDEKVEFPDVKASSSRQTILNAILAHKGLSQETLDNDSEKQS